LVVPRIKLINKLIGEPKMEWVESQFGPPADAPFRLKKRPNSRFLLKAALGGQKESLKEVAAHETFPGFFRLNW
jgi:hypothetical protein